MAEPEYADEWVASWTPDDGYSFSIPDPEKYDSEVPDQALALIACVMRLQSDPEFIGEMVEWFKSQRRQ